MNAASLMIKTLFEKNEWKYDYEEEEDRKIDIFSTGFTLSNEKVRLKIIVYGDDDMYHIIAASTESKLPKTLIGGGIYAINDFNAKSRAIGGYIEVEDGDIVFFKGSNTDALTFSEEAFEADLNILMAVVDNETAQIIKRAVSYSPSFEVDKNNDKTEEPAPKKRSLFSRIFGSK